MMTIEVKYMKIHMKYEEYKMKESTNVHKLPRSYQRAAHNLLLGKEKCNAFNFACIHHAHPWDTNSCIKALLSSLRCSNRPKHRYGPIILSLLLNCHHSLSMILLENKDPSVRWQWTTFQETEFSLFTHEHSQFEFLMASVFCISTNKFLSGSINLRTNEGA